MAYFSRVSASERRYLPPAVAVSTVGFALSPPAGASIGDAPQSRDFGSAIAASSKALSHTDGNPGVSDDDSEAVTLWLPLVRRIRPPFEGSWALPGGAIEWNETLIDTALRTLHDAVAREPGYLEQLYSFGGIERSANAERLVTIAYWALYSEEDLTAQPTEPKQHETVNVSDSPGELSHKPNEDPNIAWFSADSLPALAFDHADIVDYALQRLRLKTSYSTVAYRFLGPLFTLAQLRQVHEAVLGQQVDPANFRRQVLAQGHLVDTGEMQKGTPYRPARLYRFRAEPDHERRSTL